MSLIVAIFPIFYRRLTNLWEREEFRSSEVAEVAEEDRIINATAA
ncbi:hypothetical protein B6N60_04069 [Richelia sinica FACHB-800]|uniref:Uncharacterized protein n=1 Tax=Richelia sinica FACHB-800 TaxID=1357546 RepID=A0A975TBD8_9NOST|nr:hypothetical protein B6N60_04069 [Richelia sinica FACHB-800]